MTTQKCYLIDPFTCTITETTFDGLHDLQTLIGGYIEAAFKWRNEDVLFVDEEGMLKGETAWFSIPQRPDQALAGKGVLVGAEVEGPQYAAGFGHRDPTITLAELTALVRWAR